MLSFTHKEFYLARLVDKYYKRPHIPPPLHDNSQIESSQSKTVRFSSDKPHNQIFSPNDEPVIIESNTTDCFDSSLNRRSSQPLDSSPSETIVQNNELYAPSPNRPSTQPKVSSSRSSRLRKQPRKDYRTFLEEKDISKSNPTQQSDDLN